MREESRRTARAGVRIGALAGGILFIVFGLGPSFFLGSSGMLLLLSFITGGPVEPTVFMRSLIVLGSVFGTLAAAAAFLVAGATAGAALGYAAEALMPTRRTTQEGEKPEEIKHQ
jgi:hypothetical protein